MRAPGSAPPTQTTLILAPQPSDPPQPGDYVALIPGNAAANPYNYSGLLQDAHVPGSIVWLGNFTPAGDWIDFGGGATSGLIASLRPGYGGQAKVVTNAQGIKAGVTVGQLYVTAAALPNVAQPAPEVENLTQSMPQGPAAAPVLVTATAPASTADQNATALQPASVVATPAPVVQADDSEATQPPQVATPDSSGLLWLLLAAAGVLILVS